MASTLLLLTTSIFLSPEPWLSSLNHTKADCFCHHFSFQHCTQETAVSKRVSDGHSKYANTVWDQCITFTTDLGLNPFFQAFGEKVPVLQVFSHQVHSGKIVADGNQIWAQLIEDYLRLVAQTFLHVGTKDPRLGTICKIDFRIQHIIST